MAEEVGTVQLRLPVPLIEQADALIEVLSRDRDLSAAGRITRATVLRLAVARGLESLRQEYGQTTEQDRRRSDDGTL
jgi:hypothetical protein